MNGNLFSDAYDTLAYRFSTGTVVWPWTDTNSPEQRQASADIAVIQGNVPPNIAAAPLPPAGALDPSQSLTLDPTTTDSSSITRSNIFDFFDSLPTPSVGDPGASNTGLFLILGGLAIFAVMSSHHR